MGKEGQGGGKEKSHPDILTLRPVFYASGSFLNLTLFRNLGTLRVWPLKISQVISYLKSLIFMGLVLFNENGGGEAAGTEREENAGKDKQSPLQLGITELDSSLFYSENDSHECS